MAFFKFRKDSDEHAAPPTAPESVEALRKRARYRLTGAVVLVLAGVIGFPLLFDNQPRPIAVDIPIVIPDKAQVSALALPPVASAASAAGGAVSAAGAASAPVAGAVAASPAASAARAVAKTERPAAPPASAPRVVSDAERAQALLDGKNASAKPAAAATGRFVVQFGSFSEAGKAHDARMKVERAGFKTYAQMTQGSEGKRVRVRVGPFAKRAEAEQAAEKIKKLGLSTSILALQE